MRTRRPDFYIFSVYRPERTGAQNEDLHVSLFRYLELKTPVKHLIGVYKGVEERSILTLDKDIAYKNAIEYQQETILFRDGETLKTYLIDPRSGERTFIGKWSEVSVPSEDYTFDPESGRYFQVG